MKSKWDGIVDEAKAKMKARHEAASTEELLCPICTVEIADTFCIPDWRSDTSIPCCSDCADLIAKATRYDYNHNMPKWFREKYRQHLTNATNALLREYERLYGKKAAKP